MLCRGTISKRKPKGNGKSVGSRENLVAENPNNADIQQGIGRFTTRRADLRRRQRQNSLQFAFKALRTVEKAVASDAADTNAKTNLARTFRISEFFARL